MQWYKLRAIDPILPQTINQQWCFWFITYQGTNADFFFLNTWFIQQSKATTKLSHALMHLLADKVLSILIFNTWYSLALKLSGLVTEPSQLPLCCDHSLKKMMICGLFLQQNDCEWGSQFCKADLTCFLVSRTDIILCLQSNYMVLHV